MEESPVLDADAGLEEAASTATDEEEQGQASQLPGAGSALPAIAEESAPSTREKSTLWPASCVLRFPSWVELLRGAG